MNQQQVVTIPAKSHIRRPVLQKISECKIWAQVLVDLPAEPVAFELRDTYHVSVNLSAGGLTLMRTSFLELRVERGLAMTEQTLGDGAIGLKDSRDKSRELPVGSELLIAFALGAGGWYVIVRAIQWITG